jgi:RNA polymerase primary sigma factor
VPGENQAMTHMPHRSATSNFLRLVPPLATTDVVVERPAADPSPEALREAEAAARLHDARIELWTRLLAVPTTLPRLLARGVVVDDEIASAVAGQQWDCVAAWLADLDRPLEHATALIDHGDHPRDVAAAWTDLHAQRRSFTASHTRLLSAIVRRFGHRGVDREDLTQEGTLGLLRAVDRFDHRRGLRFSTYATWWIRNALAQILSSDRLVRVPPQTRRAQFRLIRLHEQAERRGDEAPTEQTLAAEGLSPRIVRRLHLLPAGGVQSIDPSRDIDGGACDSAHPPAADERVEREAMLATVNRAMHLLTERQLCVLERRFGLNGHEPVTLCEIGRELSLTAERVRQIEKSALEALRRALLQVDPQLPITADVGSRRRMAKAA